MRGDTGADTASATTDAIALGTKWIIRGQRTMKSFQEAADSSTQTAVSGGAQYGHPFEYGRAGRGAIKYK